MFWNKTKEAPPADESPQVDDIPSLSGNERLILQMLLEGNRELYGLEMIRESGGKLKRGTIYVTLQRMTDKGLVESRQEVRAEGESGIPRRLYKATGHGARVFQAVEAARHAWSIMGSQPTEVN